MSSNNQLDVEQQIQSFGKEIFATISKQKPSLFSSDGFTSEMMAWSMSKPALKTNLFRLVDVLPNLKSQKAVADHVVEYLSSASADIGGIIGWGLQGRHGSLRSRIAALFVRRGVKQMAKMFIAGDNAKDALKNLRRIRKEGLAFTVDLLGEYCMSEDEAGEYLARYEEAFKTLSQHTQYLLPDALLEGHPGERSPVCVSVKLTALYSQTSSLNHKKSVEVLSARLAQLTRLAAAHGAQIYVDAEDCSSNPIVYDTFKNVFMMEEFRNFSLPGIVIQAYARDSESITNDLIEYAKIRKNPIAIRLVKGAYWDSETYKSKQNNWPNPLFERKSETDANYEKLSKILLDNREHCLPAFGSHNVRSLVAACLYAESIGLSKDDFEIQALYGMAEPIAQAFKEKGYLVRLYVPLGDLVVGMGYLVRRLLENTSNESFLRHTFFDTSEVEALLQPPHKAQ